MAGRFWVEQASQDGVAAGGIARITPTGVITEFTSGLNTNPGQGADGDALLSGPDGNLWFSDRGSEAIGRISLQIPPTATSQTVIDIAPQPVAITLAGASVQNSSLTFRVVNPPSQGTLTGTAPNLAYTPSVASGQDSFTFVANDGVADSPPATVTITIVTPRLSSSVCLRGAMLEEQASADHLRAGILILCAGAKVDPACELPMTPPPLDQQSIRAAIAREESRLLRIEEAGAP